MEEKFFMVDINVVTLMVVVVNVLLVVLKTVVAMERVFTVSTVKIYRFF
jgi:uncharacterized protein HemY